ncbi:MAG: MFS transporter [bacterium]
MDNDQPIDVSPLKRTFSALQHRDYRLYWVGMLISLVGTWMQIPAQSWLVQETASRIYHTTNTSLYQGIVNAAGSTPIFLLTLIGGVFADRYDKRIVLLITQAAAMIVSTLFAIIAGWENLQIWHIISLSIFAGIFFAFDMPVRQSFAKDLVGPGDLMNAISLNSFVFNLARIIGPALAAPLLAMGTIFLWGFKVNSISLIYILNSISFLAVLIALWKISYRKKAPATRQSGVIAPLKEALLYAAKDKPIRLLLILMSVVSLFGFSAFIPMPAFAVETLKTGAKGYAMLMSTFGAGSLAGILLMASCGHLLPKGRQLFISGLTFSIPLILLSLCTHFVYALILIFFVGAGLVTSSATINSLIQYYAPEKLRGRIVGLWGFLFAGMSPIGSMFAGYIGHQFLPVTPFYIGGGICLIALLIITITSNWLWRMD